MLFRMQRIIFILILFNSYAYLLAQSCCSGGVPVSSNLGLPATQKGVLQFNLSYDFNTLQTLQSGTQRLDDDSRNRTTHSVILETGYTFNSRFSADVLLSFVQQDREITQFGNVGFTSTRGLGDAVLLFKYRLHSSPDFSTTWTIGAGPKIPLGASNRTDARGIQLNADLQPGSGAWDAIFWTQFSRSLAIRPSLSLITTGVYSYKGINDNYLGEQRYQFGQEVQLMVGLADRWLWGRQIVDPSILLRYRTVAPDQFNDNNQPGTGGSWLFFSPSLTYWWRTNFSTNIILELPLYANVTDTQVTPTYRLTVGIFYRFNGTRVPK